MTERQLFEEAYAAYLLPAEANWFKRLEYKPDEYAFDDAQDAWSIWQIARSPYWLERKVEE